MNISPQWRSAIDRFLAAETVAGKRRTTLNSTRERLEHLARRVDADPWHLAADELIDYAAAQDWKRETRRGRQAAWQAFYRWGLHKGHLTVDPTAELVKIRPGDPNPNPVPDRVYLEALIRADADEALWIDLAAEHGLRRAEIAQVHSVDVVPTLVGYDIRVHGKGGKTRLVPLTHAMARALLERDGYAFPGRHDGHISPRWLGERVSRLLPDPWTIHKLRHRAATRFWVVSGGDAYAVADLMGWANIAMVRVYVRQPTDRLRQIVTDASRSRSLERGGMLAIL
jgi:integrase